MRILILSGAVKHRLKTFTDSRLLANWKLPPSKQAAKEKENTENKILGRLCKMCDPFFYELRVVPPVNVQYSSSSSILLLYIPQTPKVKGWPWSASCRALQKEMGGGGGTMNCFVADARANLNCQFQLLVYSIRCLLNIITPPIHGLQGQYSRVPVLSFG
jgi:hypothetical protein